MRDGDDAVSYTHLDVYKRQALTLAEILAELHKHRITHKDIKPQNVLLEEATGKVYLIDFGVASHLSQETQNLSLIHI